MISVNWATNVITIPRADLVHVGGALYELDVNAFREELKDLEDSEVGITFPDTHRHNTEVTLSGVTYARTFEMINGYTITFEDVGTPYTVRCVGANHNIADVKNVNQVSLIIGNSAGLIVREIGTSGLTPDESAALTQIAADVADIKLSIVDVENGIATISSDYGFIRADLTLVTKILRNKKITYKTGANAGKMVIYDDNGTTVLLTAQIYEDQDATIPYRGSGIEHQGRLT